LDAGAADTVTGDAMEDDAMEGDAMEGDAMEDDAMEDDAIKVTRTRGATAGRDAVARFELEESSAHRWGNGPDYRYEVHSHPYHKVLYCISGAITFHTASGDVALGPGDRLDLPAGVDHAATVGENGVECVEAALY
jgi:quercetin dioxygenase-like cupin family protein